MQLLLFDLFYISSILINFTLSSSLSRVASLSLVIILQKNSKRTIKPLRVKTFFAWEHYRSKIQTASPLPVTVRALERSTTSYLNSSRFPRAGIRYCGTRIRELKAGTVGHFSRKLFLLTERAIASLFLYFYLSLSIEEKSFESSSIKSSSPLRLFRQTRAVETVCISRAPG